MAKSSNAFNASALLVALTMAIILVTTSLTSGIPISQNAFAYDTRTQATSQTSACGSGQIPTNIGCQNIGSSIQGDTNAVNIIGQQQFPTRGAEPPPPADSATLIVIKNVECIEGAQCQILPRAAAFTLTVIPIGGDAISVEGSSDGRRVTLPSGEYQVIEDPNPPVPPGLEFIGPEFGSECSGSIQAGAC
jgi:hypothetical protein